MAAANSWGGTGERFRTSILGRRHSEVKGYAKGKEKHRCKEMRRKREKKLCRFQATEADLGAMTGGGGGRGVDLGVPGTLLVNELSAPPTWLLETCLLGAVEEKGRKGDERN